MDNNTINACRAAVLARLRAEQTGAQQCAFCGTEYVLHDHEGYRPGAVCATCWPDVRAIEAGAVVIGHDESTARFEQMR